MIFVIPAIFTAVRRDFLRIDRLILTITNPARGMMVIAIKANFQLMINNKDVNVQKAIGILEDNRGIGLLDFEEEITD
jgi:hypothetical protein